MLARDLMSVPVVSVRPDAELKQVAEVLSRHGIGAAAVLDDEGRALGVVSEADVLRAMQGGTHGAHTAAHVMTSPAVCVPDTAPMARIARVMTERRVRRVLVESGHRVVGVVSRADIVRALVRPDEAIAAELDALLDDEIATIGRYRTTVRDGYVTLTGPPDAPYRTLAELLVRAVPGVIDVTYAGRATVSS